MGVEGRLRVGALVRRQGGDLRTCVCVSEPAVEGVAGAGRVAREGQALAVGPGGLDGGGPRGAVQVEADGGGGEAPEGVEGAVADGGVRVAILNEGGRGVHGGVAVPADEEVAVRLAAIDAAEGVDLLNRREAREVGVVAPEQAVERADVVGVAQGDGELNARPTSGECYRLLRGERLSTHSDQRVALIKPTVKHVAGTRWGRQRNRLTLHHIICERVWIAGIKVGNDPYADHFKGDL